MRTVMLIPQSLFDAPDALDSYLLAYMEAADAYNDWQAHPRVGWEKYIMAAFGAWRRCVRCYFEMMTERDNTRLRGGWD